ncbi:GNAT family N-acetyltransferase, partial [Vibrio breoganii]
MLIRTEAPADILVIDRLLKSVFETDAEANLVMSLRENSHLTLSLVACSDEGEVVGHLMFSPITLHGDDHNWQGLAPL